MVELLRLLSPLWDVVACVAFGGLVADLGHDRFPARERAASVLRSPLAYPALTRAAGGSPDPEVRRRAVELLGPVSARLDDLRCLWLAVGPEPEPKAFAADESVRYRLAWWADRLGIGWESDRKRLRPENDPGAFECWCSSRMPWESPTAALSSLRAFLRGKPPADDDDAE